MSMSAAQRKALEWLPADGSWKSDPGAISQALQSFSLHYPHHVESEGGCFGKRGGWKWRYRLTPIGQNLRRLTVEKASTI
jgi:hypothetical protein